MLRLSKFAGRIHDSFFGFVEQAVDYRKSYEQELYVQRAKFFS